MDPREISAAHWEQIRTTILSLTAFVGLALGGALALLLAHAVLPALPAHRQAGAVRWARRILTPLGALVLLGSLAALVLGLMLAIQVVATIYPRFVI